MKRLVFDLTKIPSLKRLIGISRLIVEVLNNQNLFTESNLADWFSSYVQFWSSGRFSEQGLKLLGNVEKRITLRSSAFFQVYLSFTFQLFETAVVKVEMSSTFPTVTIQLNNSQP